MTTYYISGPMRGHEHFNFPAFIECEEYLRSIGIEDILNPAAKDIIEGFDYRDDLAGRSADIPDDMMHRWMRRDLTDVAASDVIVLLPGWEKSEGARRELSVAKWCGLWASLYDPNGQPLYRLTPTNWDELAERCNQHDNDVEVERLLDEEAEFAQHDVETIRDVMDRAKGPLTELWAEEIFTPSVFTLDEERTVSATGGAKGVKPERHDLVPIGPMDEVARVYAFGAEKYDDHNWRKGYEWGKSYAALQRHVRAFWRGDDQDEESGLPHLAHAVFHAFALLEWSNDYDTYGAFDDRYLA